MQTRGVWIELEENRAASRAVRQVQACLRRAGPRRAVNPLFLHGPAGCGKSHLLTTLVRGIGEDRPDVLISLLSASDLRAPADPEEDQGARRADLVLVEDVQHLRPQAAEFLVALADHAVTRQRQLVVTATAGPAQLTNLPVRLTSRLAQGLVVAIEGLSPPSRLAYLRQRGEERGLAAADGVLGWLAGHVPGSVRQLEGALTRLVTLQASLRRQATLAEVEEAFAPDATILALTLDRIARQVGGFFQVDPGQIRSRRRSREVLLPRQVSMYLARRLTALPLEQIGAYFGGRDHSTVLHACRKIEESLGRDPSLGQAVRRLHADLV